MKEIPTQVEDVLDKIGPWARETIEKLSPDNQRVAAEFIEHLLVEGLSIGTVRTYILALKKFDTNGKRYAEIEGHEIRSWLWRLKSPSDGKKALSPHTVNLVCSKIARFLRWVHTGDNPQVKHPEMLRELKAKRLRRELPREILNREEIRELVDASNTQRDRALVFVAYESGARAGELVSLRLRDVELDRYGAVLHLNQSKTGARRIRLVESVPDLQLWLSMHPGKDNLDAALWPAKRKHCNPLKVQAFEWILRRNAKQAGLRKHVHPHLLRHTRATHLAKVLTEAQMREYLGWAKSSDMPEIYVHLSGRDVDGTLLKHYGIEVDKGEQAGDSLIPKPCPRCEHKNPPSAKFCMRCSLPLGIPEAMEAEEKRERAERVMEALTKFVIDNNPELLKRFTKQPEVLKEIQEIAGVGADL